jgi:hypothetical protein
MNFLAHGGRAIDEKLIRRVDLLRQFIEIPLRERKTRRSRFILGLQCRDLHGDASRHIGFGKVHQCRDRRLMPTRVSRAFDIDHSLF